MPGRRLGVGRFSVGEARCSYDSGLAWPSFVWRRFREGDQTKDVLETCYTVLRSEYFLTLRRWLETQGGAWQVRRPDPVVLHHRRP